MYVMTDFLVQYRIGEGRKLRTLTIANANDKMDTVVLEMSRQKLGAAVVLQKEKIIGIVTDGDLRRFLQIKKPVHETCVTEVMNSQPKVIDENLLSFEARLQMKEFRITQMVVVNKAKKLVGLVHIHDLGQAGFN